MLLLYEILNDQFLQKKKIQIIFIESSFFKSLFFFYQQELNIRSCLKVFITQTSTLFLFIFIE